MKKKYIVIAVLLLTCVCTLITSALGFLVFYPEYQNKEKTRTYFENLKSLDETKEQLERSNSISESATKLGQAEDTTDSNYASELEEFRTVYLVDLKSSINELIAELEQSEAPKDISETSKRTLEELKLLSGDLEEVEMDLEYLAQVTQIFVEFTADMEEILTGEFSSDTAVAITQFDQYIAEFETVFTGYKTQLSEVEVPANFKEYHSLIESDINNIHKVLISFLSEGRDLLAESVVLQNNAANLTVEQINAFTAKAEKYGEDGKNIESRFSSASSNYDLSANFSQEKYSGLQERIENLQELLSELIEYRENN